MVVPGPYPAAWEGRGGAQLVLLVFVQCMPGALQAPAEEGFELMRPRQPGPLGREEAGGCREQGP